jgi:hypothetical protein
VAAIASPYFAKFPPPTTGRTLKNIDSDTFQQCVSFMYLGEGSVVLTNDNVASILAASSYLCMSNLTQACFEYLDFHLDFENHKTISKLANQFHNHSLADKALKFGTLTVAKLEVHSEFVKAIADHNLKKRASLYAKVNEEKAFEVMARLKERLDDRADDEMHANTMYAEQIDAFEHDDSRDCFHQLLTVRVGIYDVMLSHVIIRKMQMLDSKELPSRVGFPTGYSGLRLLWKSDRAFAQAIKNLNQKLHENKRKRGHEMSYNSVLDVLVESFNANPSEHNANNLTKALDRGCLEGAIIALFDGFSKEGLILLERWRRDYLVWKRQNYEGTHRSRADHSSIARRKLYSIFTNPRGHWRNQDEEVA